MPVFNGANYIREAIDSILAQTYGDFELIVSDNASTDGTGDVVRGYAARDRRVRYYRNERNLGAARNLNRVFELASGEYFKWAAHDDVLAPECVAKCVEVLDRDPGVVLCHTRARIIDERGRVIEEYAAPLRTDSQHASERFVDLLGANDGCYQMFGVTRARALRLTSLHGSYPASDRVLLARLALCGRFHEVPEYLFLPRKHAAQSLRAHRDRYSLTAWFDPAKRGKIVFPKWRLLVGYWGTLLGAPVTWLEQARCTGHMLGWTYHNAPSLLRDLTTACKVVLLRSRAVRELVTVVKHR
jgi:glycosyltransferase involved in cell wall biosynthesis